MTSRRENVELVQDGLNRARFDSSFLDGPDFRETFWDAKDEALAALTAQMEELEEAGAAGAPSTGATSAGCSWVAK